MKFAEIGIALVLLGSAVGCVRTADEVGAAQPRASAESADRAQATCQALDAAIDAGVRDIALSQASEYSDKSAAQQTTRYLQMNNRLQLIKINVALLDQHKCPPRRGPIDPFAFPRQASACHGARQKALLAELREEGSAALKEAAAEIARACDFKTWKPETK